MSEFTHLDDAGAARMVDVSGKDVTARTATATGRVVVSADVVELLRGGGLPKGDALAVARIAGIMAAKRTPDLVPLCHPIAIHGVTVDLAVHDDAVAIEATVRTADRTGVEMEALTCVVVAGLALLDMVKAVDPAAVITDVLVVEKTGGKTGTWRRSGARRRCQATRAPGWSRSRTDRMAVYATTLQARFCPTCCASWASPRPTSSWCRTRSPRSRRRCARQSTTASI
jgi:cyclic pyranopterin monophosphate synthase